MPGALMGTLAYIAPEMFTGQSSSQAADWYAVGVTLFQGLTGRLPSYGETSPRNKSPEVPDDLNALCEALLHADPSLRAGGIETLRKMASVGAPAPGPILVGREGELAMLDEAVARVWDYRAVAIFVEGDSGIGKT